MRLCESRCTVRLCAPFECYNGGEMVYSSAGRLDICFKDFKLHVYIGNILYIHTYGPYKYFTKRHF